MSVLYVDAAAAAQLRSGRQTQYRTVDHFAHHNRQPHLWELRWHDREQLWAFALCTNPRRQIPVKHQLGRPGRVVEVRVAGTDQFVCEATLVALKPQRLADIEPSDLAAECFSKGDTFEANRAAYWQAWDAAHESPHTSDHDPWTWQIRLRPHVQTSAQPAAEVEQVTEQLSAM